MEWLNRKAPVLLLVAAGAAAAALTLALVSGTSFYADTWDVLINRRDPSVATLLNPHNEHLILIPALFEELILRLFGMTSATPEYVLLVAFLLTTAALLYVYVKRRVGPWLGLFAAVLVLFLGPAWEVLLWPFEISFCGPVLFGLAALLALEREDRRGDVAACLFASIGLGFSSLGVPFVAGVAVAVLLGPREAWRRRAYVFVIPALLYVAWYIGWGHTAESHLALSNVLASPRYVAEAMAAAVGALTGLGTDPVTGEIDRVWGGAFLIALVIGLVAYLRRRPTIYRGVWPIAAVAAVDWALAAFNNFAGRAPTASRYQYVGAIFVLMILANLFQGVRLGRRAILVAGALTALAVGPNLVVLKHGANTLKEQAVFTRADTAALDLAGHHAPSDFQLNPEVAGTPTLVNIFSGPYLEAVEEYGSPGYSPAELPTAPLAGRRQADLLLGQLELRVKVNPGAYTAAAGRDCADLGAESEVSLGPGEWKIELAPGPPAVFKLSRFAPGEFVVSTGEVPGGSVTILHIPRDASQQQWVLRGTQRQVARVCRG
jgi:hypothetical protein